MDGFQLFGPIEKEAESIEKHQSISNVWWGKVRRLKYQVKIYKRLSVAYT